MTKQEAADLLDLVIDRAPKLRELGVLSIAVGGMSASFAPLVVDPGEDGETDEQRRAREEEAIRANAWNDPETFGRREGVPGNDPRKKR